MALYIVGFQLTMGYSAWKVGLLLLPMAVFSKLSATLTQRFLNHIDARMLGMISLLGFSAGSFWVSSYNRTASFDELLWPQVLVGMFLGGLFPPLIAIALSGLRGAAEMRGTAFLNLLRVCGQAMGIPIIATLFDRRTIVHAHFLAENGGTITSMLNTPVKNARTSDYITHHAAMLAFNEIFYIAAWGFLIVAALLLLAKRVVFAEPDVRVRRCKIFH